MAKDCITLEDIDHNLSCGGNGAGIEPEVIYGYQDDVAVWPDEPTPTEAGGTTTPVSLEAAGELVGDVVMKAGTRAFKLAFTEDVGNFAIVPDGEVDGVSFNYTLNIIKAKIQALMLGFMNASANRKMFFIVTDDNGVRYLMGSKKRGARLATGGDGAATGTTGTDRNQISLSYTFRGRKALAYIGDTEDILKVVPGP